MTIKQQGGIFGRNPAFNDVEVNSLGIGTQAPTAVDLEINSSVPRFQLTDADNLAYTQFLFNTGSFAVDVDPTEAGGSSKFTIDVDNVRHFELNSSGNLTLETGNLVIGTSGKGIDFSATSGTGTSELFSDYEEGNWTPVLDTMTSGPTPGASAAYSGTYTKIGDVVFCSCLLDFDNSGTNFALNNRWIMTGLPYAPANYIFGSGNFTVYNGWSGGNNVFGTVSTSGTQVWFYVTHVDGTTNASLAVRSYFFYKT